MRRELTSRDEYLVEDVAAELFRRTGHDEDSMVSYLRFIGWDVKDEDVPLIIESMLQARRVMHE